MGGNQSSHPYGIRETVIQRREDMKSFTYKKPSTLEELLRIKKELKKKALLLAGGTNLMVYIKDDVYREGMIVDIKYLEELKGIREEGMHIEIGASETMAALINSSLLKKTVPLLPESLNIFANPVVREMSTIGGNIADASPIADTAPVLLVLNAQVIATGPSGERVIPLENFFKGPGTTALESDEIILKIRIPKETNGTGAFIKLGLRKGTSCSVTSAATWVVVKERRIEKIRIALGGVAPAPIRANKTENRFRGWTLDKGSLAGMCESLREDISPITDVRASARYRLEVSAGLLAKAIRCSTNLEE